MEILKLITLLCCTCCFVSEAEHSHNIPVENYETELQNLGEHVEVPETPVRVIKITKTIAVKVPVPYPVKVIEKVPYPVHVAKPYPVQVPQIVHVPLPHPQTGSHKPLTPHEPLGLSNNAYGGKQDHTGYKQETPSQGDEYSFVPLDDSQSYYGNSGNGHSIGNSGDEHISEGLTGGGSYGALQDAYGYTGDNEGHGSIPTKSYDTAAVKEYLHKLQKQVPSANSGHGGSYQIH